MRDNNNNKKDIKDKQPKGGNPGNGNNKPKQEFTPANPGDGAYMPPHPSSTGGDNPDMLVAPKGGNHRVKRNDPAWAQLNPTEFIEAFGTMNWNDFFNKKGANVNWAVSNYSTSWNAPGGDTYGYVYEGAAKREPVFMILDYFPALGEVLNPESMDVLDPAVAIGKYLYQCISARKKSALPVDSLSISAYLAGLQSVCTLASAIRRALRTASIVSMSKDNLALCNTSLLAAYGLSQSSIDDLIGEGDPKKSWQERVREYNSSIGSINGMMAPPDLPLFKRAWFLGDNVFEEQDINEKSTYYIFRPTWVYMINWVGDEHGTTLNPVQLDWSDFAAIMAIFKQLVQAFTGYSIGADDPNHVQAALRYVFNDTLSLPLWNYEKYITEQGKEVQTPIRAVWDEIITDSMESHNMIHNLRMINVRPDVISYSEAVGGIKQKIIMPSDDVAAQNRWPITWDFLSPEPNETDLYESSTLCAIYRDVEIGHYDIETREWSITHEPRLSTGTEIVTYIRVAGIDPIKKNLVQSRDYFSFQKLNRNDTNLDAGYVTASVASAASFGHRPLRWWYWMADDGRGTKTLTLSGCDYDTTNMSFITDAQLDKMHYTAIKSYYGINNDNTVAWVTPKSLTRAAKEGEKF